MPKLWDESIEAHRHQVRDAILDATAALVAEHGRRSVTMSQIAEQVGIGRATLYKYFGDIEAILHSWHARQITDHLHHLELVRDQAGDPRQRLEAVLNAYALIAHRTSGRHDLELVTFLHRDEQVDQARRHLHALVRDLVADGARSRQIRDDVEPDALAAYCLHALGAAGGLSTEAGVGQLVQVTMAGLRSA